MKTLILITIFIMSGCATIKDYHLVEYETKTHIEPCNPKAMSDAWESCTVEYPETKATGRVWKWEESP